MRKEWKQESEEDKPLTPEMFDDRGGYEAETGGQIAPGLNEVEQQQAHILWQLFNGLWGLCIVLGKPGAGKDLFGNYITWKIRRYFPWKRILRDETPRTLYGRHTLFNEKVLADDLMRMKKVAKERREDSNEDALERAADAWVTSKGEVLLHNSVLYLTEFSRYCYNRDPHNPMNKCMGAIHKSKRHLDCLIIGTTQAANELDRKTALPWVNWTVHCARSRANPSGFMFVVDKVDYDFRREEFIRLASPMQLYTDAGLPRSELGDGKIRLLKAGYYPEDEEEGVVLKALKAGYDTYEDIVELLETKGDMEERETLATLKELKFRPRKRVVDYPCWFSLYNSKYAPQIQARNLRMEA